MDADSEDASGRLRYRLLPPVYDVVSGEWPVYRVGRRAGVHALRARPGATVLDVGCGTGLTLPLLHEAVGRTGRVVALDSSLGMLRQARRRSRRRAWSTTTFVHADATTVDPAALRAAGQPAERGVDAVIFVYVLSLLPDWRAAWHRAVAAARPGARVAVVDMQLPEGAWSWLSPLARTACWLGGSDPQAHPWTLLEAEADDVEAHAFWGGHVQVRAGTVRGDGP